MHDLGWGIGKISSLSGLLCPVRTGSILTFTASFVPASVEAGLSLRDADEPSSACTLIAPLMALSPPSIVDDTCNNILYRDEPPEEESLFLPEMYRGTFSISLSSVAPLGSSVPLTGFVASIARDSIVLSLHPLAHSSPAVLRLSRGGGCGSR